VGSYVTTGNTMSLDETFNGSGWTIQPSADPTGSRGTSPADVSCTSTLACTAVGNYVNSSGVGATLAQRWNGTKWAVQSTPNPLGASGSYLATVSCTSASACTAVGEYNVGQNPYTRSSFTFAEFWNGTTWTRQSTPNPT
jgi:hypothetical protein